MPPFNKEWNPYTFYDPKKEDLYADLLNSPGSTTPDDAAELA